MEDFKMVMAPIDRFPKPRPRPMPVDPMPPVKAFIKLDENKDGVVSKDEFVTGKKEPLRKVQERVFDRMDKNGDGKLTIQEFLEGRKAREIRPQPLPLPFPLPRPMPGPIDLKELPTLENLSDSAKKVLESFKGIFNK